VLVGEHLYPQRRAEVGVFGPNKLNGTLANTWVDASIRFTASCLVGQANSTFFLVLRDQPICVPFGYS
jgi:hypothetical protein